ncbi:hypothetical protein C4K11_3991 [Pseudomonas chlororaphis subsp. aureofaciens]|nr:hypothetical protein C4K18_3893 [Pseudomonas chlororaphis subsp. aurantiaca]AZD68221.1 hypothetical protein C4K17_4343 [Pseudomonas chlororaphis subsp. aurantiaca]AZE06145.1 hypothetical protein C4K11_3991 [Pseudomonas chlororaphis subsp. aureofaciens]
MPSTIRPATVADLSLIEAGNGRTSLNDRRSPSVIAASGFTPTKP